MKKTPTESLVKGRQISTYQQFSSKLSRTQHPENLIIRRSSKVFLYKASFNISSSKKQLKPVSSTPKVQKETHPKLERKRKRKRKQPSQTEKELKNSVKSPRFKQLIANSIHKLVLSKDSQMKQAMATELEQRERREVLKSTNELIRKRNAKFLKSKGKPISHSRPWGSDQRQLKSQSTISFQKIRQKVRAERARAMKLGKDRIGLGAFKHSKLKKKRLSTEPVGTETVPETSVLTIQRWWRRISLDTLKSSEDSEDEFIYEPHLKIMIQDNSSVSSFSYFSFLQDEVEEIMEMELNNFFNVVSFRKREKEVDTGFDVISGVIHTLRNYLGDAKITQIANAPFVPDYFNKLYVLHNSSIGGILRVPTLEPIVDPEISEKFNRIKNPRNLNSRNAYFRMVFDCINEAFNYSRPYGIDGEPPPWAFRTKERTRSLDANSAVKMVEGMLRTWESVKAGSLRIGDHNQIKLEREIGMSNFLSSDILQNDKYWLNYDDEALQVCSDISDLILEIIIEDLINLLSI